MLLPNINPRFIENLIVLLVWFTIVCTTFGFLALLEQILHNRKSLKHKCLDSKHYH